VVARWGGDEFVAVIPNSSREIAATIAERIRVALEKATADIDGRLVGATVSTGTALPDAAANEEQEPPPGGKVVPITRDSAAARCSVPECSGISLTDPAFRENLWDRYFTAAPRLRTPSELRYSDRKLRPKS
jgi:putative transposase